jgi:hypothetical protein
MGAAQARSMVDWPDVTGLVKVVRPLTAHGGHFLVESTTDVLQYYLPDTTWRQWSSTANQGLEYYQRAIARHYFSLVILSFGQTPAADDAIALDLSQAGGYRLAAKVRSGTTVFYVWRYEPLLIGAPPAPDGQISTPTTAPLRTAMKRSGRMVMTTRTSASPTG